MSDGLVNNQRSDVKLSGSRIGAYQALCILGSGENRHGSGLKTQYFTRR